MDQNVSLMKSGNIHTRSQYCLSFNMLIQVEEIREAIYRNTSTGSMYRPGSYSNPGGYGDRYDEDRYGGRDDDRNGYGREREWGGNEDRYGRDSYGREGDRYGREYDERYTRDGYRDDDYSGRNRSIDEYNSGSRSSEKGRDHAYDDDAQYSSRESGARAEDQSQGSASHGGIDQKYSEQNLGAPPSYEEAVGAAQSPTQIERPWCHGGSCAAEYLKEHLFENLTKHPQFLKNTKLAISMPCSGIV
ncbi:clathrin interactor EPSIN 2-like isoform X2 [Ipomoea triloba]|uniref:clathrin interactor EPSIN 2-like isoform X2 n=1 Tax=Ipomoea triloba TaxID=35885 RepID=UPI00125D507E|nr:clathrin interactor EPSIN 2-like isoform X2 [Ipomoea triloba]XP_031111444.1 clathrin interactor EPSIN 2-like isoform X2 [Ipomoea triloba]XP_031111446.1 clathrin interactor EPSIN 2-like isoform X2 [Ipomoea triloba]